MYILFQGEVGIYVGDDEKCVAILKDGKVFGERALDTNDKRGATIITHCLTTCLILLKKDYKEIIYVSFNMPMSHLTLFWNIAYKINTKV